MGTTGPALRVLIVDEDPEEAVRLGQWLEDGGFVVSPTRVSDAGGLKDALADGPWDLVLVGFDGTGLPGRDALHVLKAAGADCAVIAVSAEADEAVIVEALRAGAHDFVLKRNLFRLARAAHGELVNAEVRRVARAAAAALAAQQRRLEALLRQQPEWVNVLGPDGAILEMNPAGLPMVEAETVGDAVGQSVLALVRPEHRDAFRDLTERVFRGESGVLEYEIVGRKGTPRWLETSAAPLRDEAGRVTALLGITRDVTERRVVTSERDEALRRLQLIMAGTNIGLFDWDLATDRVYYSLEWKSQLGYRSDEVADDFSEWRRRVHPDDLGSALALVEEFMATPGAAFHAEFRMRHKEGDWRWIQARGTLVRGPDGKPLRMLGTHEDITQRRYAEQRILLERAVLDAITEGEPLDAVLTMLVRGFERLLDGTTGSVLLLDEDGVHLRHASAPGLPAEYLAAIDGSAIGPEEGSCGTAAYTGETVVAEDIATDSRWVKYRDLALPHGLRSCWSVPIRSSEGVVLGTFANYHSAPRAPRSYELKAVQAGARVAGIAIERARAAAERTSLLERERRARAAAERAHETITHLLDQMTDGFVALDRDWHYIVVNRHAAELFGRRPEDLIGRHIWTEFPEGVGQPFHRAYERAMKDQVTVRFEDHFVPWDRWFENAVYPSPEGITIFFHEITDRKKAELAAERAEEFGRQIVRGVQEGIAVLDTGLRYVVWNPFMEVLTGRRSEEMLGSPFGAVLPEDEEARRSFVLRGLAGETVRAPDDILMVAGPGRRVWTSVTYSPLRDPSRAIVGVICSVSDVTERHLAEQAILDSRAQLRQLGRRLDAAREEQQARIGRDVHDALGQVLTALRIDLVRLRTRPRLAAALAASLDEAVALVDSAIKTTREVASELRPPALEELGLAAAIEWQVRRFGESSGVAASAECGDDVSGLPDGAALAAYRICQEALTNVARHARARSVAVALSRAEGAVRLEVRDDGVGIQEPDRRPQGTIGLLSMRERADAWGGTVTVSPGPGGGTVVALTLPLRRSGEHDRP